MSAGFWKEVWSVDGYLGNNHKCLYLRQLEWVNTTRSTARKDDQRLIPESPTLEAMGKDDMEWPVKVR